MKIRDEKKDIRTFGFGISVILYLIGIFRFFRGHEESAEWLFFIGLFFLIVTFSKPVILKPLFRFMSFIGKKIGRVNTIVLLGIIYYLVITPIALIFKIFRKDPLDRKKEPERKSYWVSRTLRKLPKERYEKQF